MNEKEIITDESPKQDSSSEAISPTNGEELSDQSPVTTGAREHSPNGDEPASTFAKSGKRSKKVIEAETAETERQERIAEKREKDDQPVAKGAKPVARPKIERRSKKYQAVYKLIDRKKAYSLKEAMDLAVKTSPVKFDASVELHIGLNVDPRQADQNIRSTVALPHGTGKTIRLAAFVPADQIKTAIDAGADVAGEDEIVADLNKGIINFDILIATPATMAKLGKFARTLGPKGLMPNPKAGTVTTDIAKAVKEAKAGKVEYRVDKQSIVHLAIGKVSFGADKLVDNAEAVLTSLAGQKPSSIKGVFVKNVYVATTMGPSIKLENTLN